MTTLLDHKTTLAYLAYLGYPDEPRTSALQVTRARKIDRRKGKVSRNVFLCYVCGAAGSGKTSLLRAFLKKPFSDIYEPTSKMMSAVNAVDIEGSEKYLVVSTSIGQVSPISQLYLASRIRLKIRSRNSTEFQEDGSGRCHSLRAWFERHQFVFLHQQSTGTATCCHFACYRTHFFL